MEYGLLKHPILPTAESEELLHRDRTWLLLPLGFEASLRLRELLAALRLHVTMASARDTTSTCRYLRAAHVFRRVGALSWRSACQPLAAAGRKDGRDCLPDDLGRLVSTGPGTFELLVRVSGAAGACLRKAKLAAAVAATARRLQVEQAAAPPDATPSSRIVNNLASSICRLEEWLSVAMFVVAQWPPGAARETCEVPAEGVHQRSTDQGGQEMSNVRNSVSCVTVDVHKTCGSRNVRQHRGHITAGRARAHLSARGGVAARPTLRSTLRSTTGGAPTCAQH